MDEIEANKRLSIIDVSFEDDCLLDLSSSTCRAAEDRNSDMGDNADQETRLFESIGSEKWSSTNNSFRDLEKSFPEVPQPFQSCEPEMYSLNGKYNLRKSLAWDSAFFTSAGVLEPEELTCIIEGSEKKGRFALPRIQEETSRSTESISTLESDSLTIASLEAELFQDIRASIQKSAKSSIKDIPNGKTGLKPREKPPAIASAKVDPGSHSKSKATIGSKKPSVSVGKNIKQLSGVPNMSQIKSVATNGEPIQLPSRPPKLRANRSQLPKRDYVGSNCAKPGNSTGDNAVRGSSLSKAKVMSCPRRSSARPSRSSISNSEANTESATSRSSIESLGSASSISLGKSPIKFKNTNSDSSSRKSASSNEKAPPNGSQPTPTHLSSCLMLTSKLSSSISPSSSISELSSESSSSISSVARRSNSGKVSSIHGYPSQARDLLKLSHDRPSLGNHTQGSTPPSRRNPQGRGAALPNNMKPTGLRMPSPNMGYFDGVKSGCTPKGVKQRPQTANTASNGSGSKSISASASASSNKGNSEKLASATKAASPRIGNGHLTSEARDSPRKLTDAKAVAARAHSNVKNSPGPTSKGKSQEKEEPINSEGCDLSAEFVDKDGLWSAFQLDETLNSVDCPLIPFPEKSAIKACSEAGAESLNAKKEEAADGLVGACSEAGAESLNAKKEEAADGLVGNQSFISELVSEQRQPKEDTTVAQEVLNSCGVTASPTRPFSLKDSFCNQICCDVSGLNVEKEIVSPVTNGLKENI